MGTESTLNRGILHIRIREDKSLGSKLVRRTNSPQRPAGIIIKTIGTHPVLRANPLKAVPATQTVKRIFANGTMLPCIQHCSETGMTAPTQKSGVIR